MSALDCWQQSTTQSVVSSFIYNAKMKRHTCGKEAACMRKKVIKPNYRKVVLRLPDLDHAKASVLNSLSSPKSRRNYRFAMDQFIAWYCSEPHLALNRTVVQRFDSTWKALD
jgi:hypothetical protein